MSARRPSLDATLDTMVRYPVDIEADLDLVDALGMTVEAHTPTQAHADRRGHYGRCGCCREWWPCGPYRAAEQAAQVWLWEAAQTVIAKYRKALA